MVLSQGSAQRGGLGPGPGAAGLCDLTPLLSLITTCLMFKAVARIKPTSYSVTRDLSEKVDVKPGTLGSPEISGGRYGGPPKATGSQKPLRPLGQVASHTSLGLSGLTWKYGKDKIPCQGQGPQGQYAGASGGGDGTCEGSEVGTVGGDSGLQVAEAVQTGPRRACS